MLVLESKYQGWQGLGGRVDGKNECMWWRDLKIVCGGVEQISWFGKVVEWNIGDGRKTRFWADGWSGGECLTKKYPKMFLNFEQKGDNIANMGRMHLGKWEWVLKWKREWFKWERNMVANLYNSLELTCQY